MSCNSGCQKNSDNGGDYYSGCQRMADGRIFTNWMPRCADRVANMNANKFKSSYEYRQWLIHNGEKMMNDERQALLDEKSCKPCFDFSEPGTMLPERRMLSCDANVCSVKMTLADGLGIGGRNQQTDKDLARVYPAYGMGDHQRYGSVL